MVEDTIMVELHNAIFSLWIVDQAKIVLNSSGFGTANFISALCDRTSYYIVIKHRNAIETWSAKRQSFTGGTMSYDFTTVQIQALGQQYEK